MIRPVIVAVAFAFAAGAAAVFAATLTPSALVANPSSFDGKPVTVAGTVSHFQTSSTMMGTVAGFQLCDSKCIVVIDQKNTTRHNGDKATVSGTFYVTFKAPKRSFNNAVVVK